MALLMEVVGNDFIPCRYTKCILALTNYRHVFTDMIISLNEVQLPRHTHKHRILK